MNSAGNKVLLHCLLFATVSGEANLIKLRSIYLCRASVGYLCYVCVAAICLHCNTYTDTFGTIQ